MKTPPHIAPKDKLAQYQQISTFVYHVLSVAQAGGMKEKQAQEYHKQIMDAYCKLKGNAFWQFRDEVIRILVTNDSEYDKQDGGNIAAFGPGSRN